MSESSDLYLDSEEKTVTAAGTQEKLKTGSHSEVAVLSVTIKALSTNTDKIYIGGDGVASTSGFDLDPRDSVTYESDSLEHPINMADIWIDAAVSGEGVRFTYLRL